MQIISGDQFQEFIPQKPRKKKSTSERAELIGWFTDELNKTRGQGGFRKLSYSVIGIKLSHIPTEDLYYLQSQMKNVKNSSAYFWWSLRPENIDKKDCK